MRALLGASGSHVDLLEVFGGSLLGYSGSSSSIFALEKIYALSLVFFLVGFFSFPPHSLIGLTSRELAPGV